MAFKENMQRKRASLHLTQDQAARILGISQKNLNAYEWGSAHPRWPVLKKILDGYEIKKDKVYQFMFE